MKKLLPVKNIGGTITVPGDKSIGHRIALLSLLVKEPVTVLNYPSGQDCQSSLKAVQALGVKVEKTDDRKIILTPPEEIKTDPELVIDCGNSGTTTRLLSGIIAGSPIEVTLSGDESLQSRPMKRIIDPLTEMGAELFSEDGHLPMRIKGNKLLSFEYRMPVPSAQVKSSLLLAGLASGCSVTIREETITRDHTELMIEELGGDITVRNIKAILVEDPNDPRKRKMEMPESFKKEIILSSSSVLNGGEIDIPGDISTASFFMAAAVISGNSITINNLGLNKTRTAFIDYLKGIGAEVRIEDRRIISGEPRGNVTVTGLKLKSRKISGGTTVGLIDEIPIVSVIAAFAPGTTIIRDAAELKVKESDRLNATAENLKRMGIKCGLLEDGLAIEGGHDLSGADFVSYGDHRIAMAFSIASLFLVGPSTIDDEACIDISCPEFYDLLDKISNE